MSDLEDCPGCGRTVNRFVNGRCPRCGHAFTASPDGGKVMADGGNAHSTSEPERCDGCGVERHPAALKPVDTPLGKRQLCVSCFGEEPPRTQDTEGDRNVE